MIKKSSGESESDVAVFHLSHIDKTYSFRAIGTTERLAEFISRVKKSEYDVFFFIIFGNTATVQI